MIIQLAWRQVLRYKRYMIINSVSIFVIMAMVIFYVGMMRGYVGQMERMIIQMQTADFQVHPKGYLADAMFLPIDQTISGFTSLQHGLLDQEGVAQVAARIEFSLMLSNGEDRLQMQGVGIEPGRESGMMVLDQRITSGRYLSRDDRGILLGEPTAALLGLSVGDLVWVYAKTQDQVHNVLPLPVLGVFSFGFQVIDRGMIFMPLPLVQSFLNMPDQVTKLMIQRSSAISLSVLGDQLAMVLPPEVQIDSWQRFQEGFVQDVKMNYRFLGLLMGLLVLVGGLSILNTVSMSIVSRYSEFGTLMAIGYSWSFLARLLFLELCLMAGLGIVLGLMVGGGLDYWMVNYGIPFPKEMAEMVTVPLPEAMVSKVSWVEFVGASFLAVLATFGGGLWPVLRLRRKSVVELLSYRQ